MEDDFDDYLEIEADATDFTMNETYCIATNSVFSRLDLSNVDDLEDATNKLLDGTSDLYDGVTELYDKSGDLQDGVKELSDGSGDLRDGAYKLADGAVTLRGGIGSLQEGTKALLAGTPSLQSGTNELKTGLGQLTAQNDTLNGAAGQVFDTLLKTATSQLTSAGLSVPDLTTENYAQVLNGAISKLTDMDTEDLQEVIDRMKATSSVSENYDSFTVSNDGMDSSVKFIYKINAVK